MIVNSLINKLKKRKLKNLIIKPVFLKDSFYLNLIHFLENQTYLNVKKIKLILKNNFLLNMPIGYVMIDGFQNIVGFLGTIFSNRTVNESEFLQCCLHTWIVDKKYRLYSHNLLLQILEEYKDLNIFTFNPIYKLERLYLKFNFSNKIFYKEIFLFNFLNFFKKKNYQIINEKEKYYDLLNNDHKKIFNDHSNLNPGLNFLFFKNINSSKFIFIITKKMFKKPLHYIEILYVSDFEEYAKHIDNINCEIFLKFKTFLIIYYNFSNFKSLSNSKIYFFKKKNTLFFKNFSKNHILDPLYSEFV